jgi:cytochrome P450
MALPNGPKTPHLLQQIQWVTNPIGYMEAAQNRYGDMFAPSVPDSKNVIFVSNPQALKQILTNDTKDFAAPGKLNKLLAPLVGNHSVLFLDGESHQRERKLMMPPFHGDVIQSYGQIICEITQKVMNQWTSGTNFSALSAVRDISLRVIIEVVFGVRGERDRQLRQLLLSLIHNSRSPLTSAAFFFPFLQRDLGLWSPWGNFLHIRKQIDQFLYAEIDQRRQQPVPEQIDILTSLILARDEANEPMTNQELRDELMTLLIAGHDISANAIAWSLYLVYKHPEVLDKLLQELNSLGESPDPMTIFRLPYLSAVCNETLRMYPVNIVATPRMVQSPVELMGYDLHPGTVLLLCIYLTHHREDLYPEPKLFKPERFLERQFSPYEFLPFGGGVRRCLGVSLAQLEMKLVLATILSRYQLALSDHRPERIRTEGILLVPAGGVKMVMQGKYARQKELLASK